MKEMQQYFYKTMSSPVGTLKLVGSDRGLAAILWEREAPGRVKIVLAGQNKKLPLLVEAEKQLKEYFAGTRKKFDLKLDFAGTEFQKKVWRALLNIPYGKTVSYADIARTIGHPKAARAVGSTSRRNPISIIAACHRVVGSSGRLVGYAGGLTAKTLLLTHEGQRVKGKPHPRARIAP